MTDAEREHFDQSAHVLGTTLQVSRKEWPESRRSFDDYWARGLEHVHFDDEVCEHVLGIAELRMLPQLASLLFGSPNRWITIGFLHAEFRDALSVAWLPVDQRRFNRLLTCLSAVNRRLSRPIREIAYRALLLDLRVRMRFGKSLM